MTRVRFATLFVLLALLAAPAHAQTDFGSIKGYITDQSGASLPGVTVTVRSSALQGVRTSLTDEEGFYRVLNLPPGGYELTAELAGFSKVVRPAIAIRAGLNVSVDLQMQVGQMSETVQVTADAPILEAEKTDLRVNIDGEFLRALPLTPGHDWWDALKVVPGVLILGGSGGTLESRGAGLSSNLYLLDGIDISDVQQNAAGGTQIPVDAVDDIRVSTAGQDASSRMAVGANLMMVSRSGSNTLSGSLTSDMQPKSLNDTNIPGGSPADQTIYQYTGTLGGPAIRDSLWYFGSYRYLSQEFGIARKPEDIARLKLFQPSFEAFNRHLPTHQLLVKGTYQATKNDQIVPTYQYNRTLLRNNGNDPTWTEERALGQYSGGPLYGITYNRVFGNWGTMTAQAGGYSKPFEVKPQGDGPNVVYYNATIINAGRPVASGPALANTGNVQSVNRSEQRRANINVDFTAYVPRMFGSHEFKVGLNATPLHEYEFINTSSNDGFILEDRVLLTPGNPGGGSRPFHRRYEEPVRLEGVGKSANNYGLYLQDTWRPGKRWVLNVGVRFDKSQTYDTWGDPIQSSWQGGPRLGATYRLTAEGNDVVRASYNRMYDATNLLFAFSEGSLRKGSRDEYDADGDGVFETVLTTPALLERPAPALNTNRGIIDPDLRQPRTEEFTTGYSRQLPWRMAADVTFVYRQYRDKMVAFDTNGIYENGRFLGYRDPNYNQIYMVTNGDQNWLTYKSLDFALHKSLSHELQFLAGYSYANLAQRGTWDLNDPASFLQPDAFANSRGVGRTVNPSSSQANSYSTASYANTGTPPHNFKLNATYIAPYDITVGFSYLYQMGQWSGPIFTLIPQSEVTHPSTVTLSNGRVVANPLATRTRFYYSTRNEGQTTAPALSEVNLRVGKRFRFRGYAFEAAIQGFNILNRGDDLFFNSPTLVQGQPATFTRRLTQAPRAGQVTLRASF
jgi:hypothetical protein